MGDTSVGVSVVSLVGKLLDESACSDVPALLTWLAANQNACEVAMKASKEEEERLRDMVGLSRASSTSSAPNARRKSLRELRRERSGGGLSKRPPPAPLPSFDKFADRKPERHPSPQRQPSPQRKPNSNGSKGKTPPGSPSTFASKPSSLLQSVIKTVDSVLYRRESKKSDHPLLMSVAPAEGGGTMPNEEPNPSGNCVLSDVDEHDEVGDSDSDDGAPEVLLLGEKAVFERSQLLSSMSPPPLLPGSPGLDVAPPLNPLTLNFSTFTATTNNKSSGSIDTEARKQKKRSSKKRRNKASSRESSLSRMSRDSPEKVSSVYLASPSLSPKFGPKKRVTLESTGCQTEPLVIRLSDIQETRGVTGVVAFNNAVIPPPLQQCPNAPLSSSLSPKASHQSIKTQRVAFSVCDGDESLPSPPRSERSYFSDDCGSPGSPLHSPRKVGKKRGHQHHTTPQRKVSTSPQTTSPANQIIAIPPHLPALSVASDSCSEGELSPRAVALDRISKKGSVWSRMSRSSSLRLSKGVEELVGMKRNTSYATRTSMSTQPAAVSKGLVSPPVPHLLADYPPPPRPPPANITFSLDCKDQGSPLMHLSVPGGGGDGQRAPPSPSLSVLQLMDSVNILDPHAMPQDDRERHSFANALENGNLKGSFRRAGRSLSRHSTALSLSQSQSDSDRSHSSGQRSLSSAFMNRRGSYSSSNIALRARLSLAPASDNTPKGSDCGGTLFTSPRATTAGYQRTLCKNSTSFSLEEEEEVRRKEQEHEDMLAYEREDREAEDGIPLNEQQQGENRKIRLYHQIDRFWLPVVFLYSLYQLVMVPARIGLDSPAGAPMLVLDMVMDLIFFTEIFLRFNRPTEVRGMIISDSAVIRKRYLKKNFWWDVVTALPLDVIGLILYAQQGGNTSPWRHAPVIVSPLWRLNRLGLMRYADSQFTECSKLIYAGHPLLVRACRTFWAFTLTTHYVTCIFLAMQYYEGEEIGFFFTGMRGIYTGDISSQYFLGYDYCVKAMVGMGRPGKVMPQTDLEAIFCILQALLGVGIYAAVLSTVSNLIVENVSDDERWRRKINEITDILKYISNSGGELPADFTSEIREYFHHDFWVSRVLLGCIDTVMEDLPPRISRKVEKIVGGETLSRVTMFKQAIEESPAFLHFMLSRLEPKNFCKGEVVMQKGEEGHCMYFVMSGKLGVWSEETEAVVAVCPKGSSLGEIALLQDCRRTATVKALEMSSVFVLSREALEQAEDMFPTAIAHVRLEAESKLQKIKQGEIVGKVPLFAKYANDTAFINDVVGENLKFEVQPPDTTIVTKGAVGDKMYFVSQGKLSVLDDNGETVATLQDGSFFGEICILFDARRTATVVSKTHVVLFSLTRDAYAQIRKNYPDQAQSIQDVATQRYRSYVANELFKSVPYIADMLEEEEKFEADVNKSMSLPPSVSTQNAFECGRSIASEVSSSAPKASKFVDMLASCLHPRSLNDDECVVTVGQPLTEMIFVATGTVAVISENDVLEKCLEPGDMYGAMSLLFFHWAPDTLIALRPSVVYTLSLQDYRELLMTFKEAVVLKELGEEKLKCVVFERLLTVTNWGVMRAYYFKLLSHCRMVKFADLQLHSQQTRDVLRSIRRR